MNSFYVPALAGQIYAMAGMQTVRSGQPARQVRRPQHRNAAAAASISSSGDGRYASRVRCLAAEPGSRPTSSIRRPTPSSWCAAAAFRSFYSGSRAQALRLDHRQVHAHAHRCRIQLRRRRPGDSPDVRKLTSSPAALQRHRRRRRPGDGGRAALVFLVITWLRAWKYLWTEWLTGVDTTSASASCTSCWRWSCSCAASSTPS